MSRPFPSRPARLACAALLLLAAVLAPAQENLLRPPLPFAEALRLATERHPALLAQGHHERAAAALIEQAGQRPPPTLDVSFENFAGTGTTQGVRGLEATVQAGRTFERGGKRDKRVALAGRDRETAARELTLRRTEVRALVATTYLEALAAQQRRELAGEPLRLAREMLAAVDLRVQAGAASPAESARARAALAATEAEFARAEAAVLATRAALAATWGGEADEIASLPGTFHLPASLPDRAARRARLAAHPRLDLQQSVLDGRRAALELEQAQAVQDISVGGGVRFLREGSDAAFVAGVSVPLPVRNRNQGNLRAARETIAAAEQGARAVEVELRAAFNAAWQELTAAHHAARHLRAQALPATAEAHAAVRLAYEQGQLPFLDVLDAQRALGAVRREILDAEIACALALARLDALTDPDFGAVSALLAQP